MPSIPSSPINYWKFDEGTGTNAADSAGSLAGVLTGGPTWGTGKIGPKCVTFDGVDDYVLLSSATGPGSAYSVAAWLRPSSVTSVHHIFTQYDFSGATKAYTQLFANAQAIQFRMHQTAGNIWIGRKTGNVLAIGTWLHLCCVWDGTAANSGCKIYINGVQADNADDGSGSFSAVGQVALTWRIGTQWGGTADSPWAGDIDEVLVYNRALTANEVSELYTYQGFNLACLLAPKANQLIAA